MTTPLTAREMDEIAGVGVGWCDEATFERLLSMARASLDGGEWRGIESAPRDGTQVLLWDRLVGLAQAWWDVRMCEWVHAWDGETIPTQDDLIYWRPLPAPPNPPQEASPDEV